MILYPTRASETTREYLLQNQRIYSDTTLTHLDSRLDDSSLSMGNSIYQHPRRFQATDDVSVTQKRKNLREMLGTLALAAGTISSFGCPYDVSPSITRGVEKILGDATFLNVGQIVSIGVSEQSVDDYVYDIMRMSNPHLPAPEARISPAQASVVGIENAEPPDISDDLWSL